LRRSRTQRNISKDFQVTLQHAHVWSQALFRAHAAQIERGCALGQAGGGCNKRAARFFTFKISAHLPLTHGAPEADAEYCGEHGTHQVREKWGCI